jgi:hypothetical protein
VSATREPPASVAGADIQAAVPGSPRQPVRHLRLKRAAMAGATAFVTVNMWTGCPLLALWVGSQAVGRGALSMGAVGLVVVVLAVLVFAFALALTWLNNVYDELVGRPRAERRARWLRSMRAEDEGYVSQRVGITLLERIVMINVYLCMIAFAAWYVFLAGAPSPSL